MANEDAVTEVDRKIALIRENLRTLVEQAAGYSGAADEDRNADRIADQERLLAELQDERARLQE